MKTKQISISALALLFVACQQGGEELLLTSNGEMAFNVATRSAANNTVEAKDKMGVYVTDYVDATTPAPLQVSGNRANNEGVIFDGAKWTAEQCIYWGEGKCDIYAYYPYMAIEDIDEQPFSVALDQTVEGAYESSDLLWAKTEGVQQSDGPVSLAMKHQMSRLVVKIMAGKEYIGSLPTDATVHLHSTVTDACFSLVNGSVMKDPYSGAKSILMHNLGIHKFAEGDAVVYEAIVVPQMLETSVPLLEINSKSVSYLLEDTFNFRPGVSYTYTVVLNASTTAIKVEIGCEIEDWNNIGGGSEGVGGSGSEGGNDDGVDLSLYTDLSAEGTANCYLVQSAGNYKFKALLGNTNMSVGNIRKSDVLWESFGTDIMPNVGDLITEVGYQNGYVYFSTPENFKNGNASIAVRNSKDVILWSWHIWCSVEGWIDHVYPNNAGTMMDRNLGAISATPGDIGAFGLMYQWGRKDPFMGSCTKSRNTLAASSGTWNVGTSNNKMNYAEGNPMIFATDWHGDFDPVTGWNTSEFAKGLYDPCPVGYRVPDGGKSGFWAIALGATSETYVNDVLNYEGVYLALADGTTAAWYPVTGSRAQSGNMNSRGVYCWSASIESKTTSNSFFINDGLNIAAIYPVYGNGKADGIPVRCVKEK